MLSCTRLRSRLASVFHITVSLVLGASLVQTAEIPPIVFVATSKQSTVLLPWETRRPAPDPKGPWTKLSVLEPDGTTRTLVANTTNPPSAPVDFADPDVSYDGLRVLFSGYSASEEAWRIYEVNADGSNLRQLTHSDRELDLSRYGSAAAELEDYDDLDPCYLPDGRICMSSTRYPEIAPVRGRATNLYVLNGDGSDLHRITHERYGADTPTVDPASGKIVYSRWWQSVPVLPNSARRGPRTEEQMILDAVETVTVSTTPPGGYYSNTVVVTLPPEPTPAINGISEQTFSGVNNWTLSSIRPDGTDLQLFAGFHFDRELTQAWRPTFLPSGDVAALFLVDAPFTAAPSAKGLRVFKPGIGKPVSLGGFETFQRDRVNDLDYAAAAALPSGDLIVSAARAGDKEHFDLYLQTPSDQGTSVPVRLLATENVNELDPVPLVAREKPPILADRSHSRPSEDVAFSVEEAFERGGSFKFIVENIFANAPVDVGVPNAPAIGRDLTIEFYTVPQGLSPGPADPALLIASKRVPPSGRVEVELPAEVPLFELLRTQDGKIAQGRDGQVYHVGGQNFGHAGVEARCVGCHAGHSTQKVPEDPRFTNIAPGADLATTTSRRNEKNSTWFHPNNLVDRDTTPRVGDWAGDLPARVELSWPDRVVARELILYAPRQDDPEFRNPIQLEGALLRFFAGTGEEVHRVELEQPIEPTGTRVPLDENIAFRRVRVSLARDQVSGSYPTLSSQVAAIAEIEITGRSIEPPFRFFARGDADCNQTIDVTDALQMFSGMLTDITLCCESAADLDRNQVLNINDPMVLLNHLFLNSPPPPGPFPLCGKGHSALNCAEEMCK